MFKQRTLFILGAGASKEVNIPLGTELARQISELLHIRAGNRVGETLLKQLYDRFPVRDNAYNRAAVAIHKGVRLANSIDDFLDRHSTNNELQLVGKAAIARAILYAESQSSFGRNGINLDQLEDKWHMRFFRMLGAEVRVSEVVEIFKNVTFIVFNYDRCLEHFLVNALQLVYQIPLNHAQALVSAAPIIHPYGVIAPLCGDGWVPFGGADAFEHDCSALVANVKIFTEQMTDKRIKQRIHEAIRLAEQIVILGFGYHDTNMELLRPPAALKQKPLFGTASGMSDASIQVVQRQLAAMFAGTPAAVIPSMQISDMKCAAFFDYHAKSLPG
jgi:hypothetical protein